VGMVSSALMLDHRKAVGCHWDEVGSLFIHSLLSCGLEPHHLVLEVGCGSLRCGHQIIRYLDPSKYYAVDPMRRLVERGIKHELPEEVLEEKKPSFAFNHELLLAPEDEELQFDFIVAHAVFTHFGPESLERFLFFARSKLAAGGKIVLALHYSDDETLELGKTSPLFLCGLDNMPDLRKAPALLFRTKVFYPHYLVEQIVDRTGLELETLPWRHPDETMSVSQRMLLLTPACTATDSEVPPTAPERSPAPS
jgi:hypothetical protein